MMLDSQQFKCKRLNLKKSVNKNNLKKIKTPANPGKATKPHEPDNTKRITY